MKKLIIVMLLLCVGLITFGQEDIVWGSYYEPGNVLLEVEGVSEFNDYIWGLGAVGSAELILAKPQIEGAAPFDFGLLAAVRAGMGFSDWYSEKSALGLGVGAMGTVHFGLRGILPREYKYLETIDMYLAMGLCYDIMQYQDPEDFNLGFAARFGVNYFINDSIAVSVSTSYWEEFTGFTLGIQLKFGNTPVVKGTDYEVSKLQDPKPEVSSNGGSDKNDDSESQVMASLFGINEYVAQFYALYWLSVCYGGYYFDDYHYKMGKGALVKYTDEEGDSFTIHKARVAHDRATKITTWIIELEAEDTKLTYQIKTNSDREIKEIKYINLESGLVETVTPKGDEMWYAPAGSFTFIDITDAGDKVSGRETITTALGTITADVFEIIGDGVTMKWYVSLDAIGGVPLFTATYDDGSLFKAEVIKNTENNKPLL